MNSTLKTKPGFFLAITWTWLQNVKLQERNWISSNSITKQCHISKQTLIIHYRIASVDCVEKKNDMVHLIINRCNKLTQKENKTRHNWVRKVIHWELCKRLKYDHTIKQYMHKPESILENETNKILWDFKMKKKKKNLLFCGFYHSSKSQNLNKRKQEGIQIPGSCQRIEKTMEHESQGYMNCS